MANTKISEMQEASVVNNNDYIPIVQGGVNKKAQASLIGSGGGGVSGDTLPIGSIVEYGGSTAPTNWLICDGSAVSRTTYADLFTAIGTNYGSGDGSTTFNLPDLRGKVPVGLKSSDTDFDTLGETGGEKKHTLTVNEMPDFELDVKVSGADYPVINSAYQNVIGWEAFNKISAGVSGSKLIVEHTGGGQSHNILQPYIVTNYIIKASQSAGVVATVVDSLNSDSSTDALSAKQGKILNDKSIYSTIEKVVGTWVDGKPIYRKIYQFTTTNDMNLIEAHGLTNLSKYWINLSASHIFNNTESLPVNWYYSSNDWARTWMTNTNLRFRSPSNLENRTLYLVVEYTKTTD